MKGHKIKGWQKPEFVKCKDCGFRDKYHNFKSCKSIWQDILCPKCGSTNNDSNDNYQNIVFGAVEKVGLTGLLFGEIETE